MTKKLIVILGALTLIFLGVLAVNMGGFSASSALGMKSMIPIVGISALLDSINPCAFSVLLLTIAFLFSLGQNRRGILKIGATYILGLFTVYMAIGLGLLQALSIWSAPHLMAKVGAALLIAVGLFNLGNAYSIFKIEVGLPKSIHPLLGRLIAKASLPGAFLVGALVASFEFPCTGGPYLFVLGLLHDQETALSGLGYLTFYNLVFVLPLILILALGSDATLLKKVETWKHEKAHAFKLWTGVSMVLLGISMLFL